MYCISDKQIDYILSDISARGVELESLQLNLLDHICCLIENGLEENGDFDRFYQEIIRKFYKDKLSEIEEETHLLLNNKNYYVMKKVMISSGVFAATALTAGIAFKYMQWNGASIMMTVGILTASLIFLPLLFMLKMKEEQEAKNKLLLTLGTLSAIMMAMAILFKVQHWPGANAMGVASPAILALVFLPVYFFTGIRNAATKVNTIVTSVLIIVGCGLFFTLTITPKSIALITIRNTNSYLRSEQILKNEAINLAQLAKTDTANIPDIELGNKVYNTCEELKGYLLQYATGGSKTIDGDFESKEVFIRDANTQDYLSQNPAAAAKLDELAKAVTAYNNATAKNGLRSPIPMSYTIVNTREHKVLDKVTSALNDLLQVQMLVLQNRIELYAAQNDKGLTALK